MTNRERIEKLSNHDYTRFMLIIAPRIQNQDMDNYTALENWLLSGDPGNLYRNLMNDWS